MKRRINWASLFSTTFLGVFNANYLKLLIITIGVTWMEPDAGNHSFIVSLTSALFFVSYIFFSPLAGKLAKVMYKKQLIIWIRVAQFPIYLLACTGFFMQNLYVVLICMFFIGVTAALYAPAKYSLIRDVGGVKGISFGTGTLEMLTFFGNILGPFAASVISDHYNFWLLAGVMAGAAILSFVVIILMRVEETEPMKNVTETTNPIKFLIASFRWAKTFPGMNLVVLGLGSFWMMDAVLQMNLFVHCPETLKISNTAMGVIMAIALVGIGLGSFLAGVLSRGKVQLLFTPIGGVGMALSLLLLVILRPTDVYLFTSLIFFAAMFSGVFMVPLSATIQSKVEGRKQADMIAYSNFITYVLLFTASALFGVVAKWLGTNAVFAFDLVIVIAITLVLMRYVPELRAALRSKKKDD